MFPGFPNWPIGGWLGREAREVFVGVSGPGGPAVRARPAGRRPSPPRFRRPAGSRRPISAQELERVPPAVPPKAGNAPQDAQRLDRTRRLGRTQVLDVPAEALEDRAHLGLGGLVVAADEHGG